MLTTVLLLSIGVVLCLPHQTYQKPMGRFYYAFFNPQLQRTPVYDRDAGLAHAYGAPNGNPKEFRPNPFELQHMPGVKEPSMEEEEVVLWGGLSPNIQQQLTHQQLNGAEDEEIDSIVVEPLTNYDYYGGFSGDIQNMLNDQLTYYGGFSDAVQDRYINEDEENPEQELDVDAVVLSHPKHNNEIHSRRVRTPDTSRLSVEHKTADIPLADSPSHVLPPMGSFPPVFLSLLQNSSPYFYSIPHQQPVWYSGDVSISEFASSHGAIPASAVHDAQQSIAQRKQQVNDPVKPVFVYPSHASVTKNAASFNPFWGHFEK